MGKGTHNTQNVEINEEFVDSSSTTDIPHRLPTLSEIKVKLPAHCFRPTVRQSMSYVLKDLIYITLTFFVMYQIQSRFTYGFLLFPLYWYIQGTLYTGLFILGHDCGHASFSFYPLLNDTVGTILHTWILTPYYPWKLTHNHHHKNTGNIDKDEVFYPQRNTAFEPSYLDKVLVWLPGIAWFHYLQKGYYPRQINHYNPLEKLFSNRHLLGVCLSLTVYAGMFYLMYLFANTYGFLTLINYHLIPVFFFASYIVIITLLHHTEVDVPWYADSEWNNVKGQLSTVDRHYGHAHHMIHQIGTHQIHHLFSKIPHYHLEEATGHFRQCYPHLVRISNEPILRAFSRMFTIFLKQRAIDNDIRVFTYKDECNMEEKKKYK